MGQSFCKLQDAPVMGVTSVMLTGDNERTGRAIAEPLGMDVRAGFLPDRKLREIEALKARSPVVMVGDGINDAPALAAASVGVAMGGGTAVTLGLKWCSWQRRWLA